MKLAISNFQFNPDASCMHQHPEGAELSTLLNGIHAGQQHCAWLCAHDWGHHGTRAISPIAEPSSNTPEVVTC